MTNAVESSVLQDGEAAPGSFEIDIQRRSGIDMAEFVARYRRPRHPVILTDAAREWPLYAKASPEWFRREHGQHRVRVKGRDYALGDLLDELAASTPEHPGPYPCKFAVARDFPQLLDEVTPRFVYSLPDRQAHSLLPQRLFHNVNNLEIFFGGPGGEFPYLHYDVMRLHAWITQLHGDKEFTLYAPGQEHLLYVNPEIPWQSSIENHHDPDYDRYPLFRQAQSHKVVVHAGETLFLPCGWWHTARSLNQTISIAFDQLGADNWSAFIGDVVAERKRLGHPGKALMLGAYLHGLGLAMRITEWMGANHERRWGKR